MIILHSHRGTTKERAANNGYPWAPQGFIRWKTEFRFIISFVANSNPHFSISSDQQTSRSFSAGECGFLNCCMHPLCLLRVVVNVKAYIYLTRTQQDVSNYMYVFLYQMSISQVQVTCPRGLISPAAGSLRVLGLHLEDADAHVRNQTE